MSFRHQKAKKLLYCQSYSSSRSRFRKWQRILKRKELFPQLSEIKTNGQSYCCKAVSMLGLSKEQRCFSEPCFLNRAGLSLWNRAVFMSRAVSGSQAFTTELSCLY